jgi:hypothetical protein
MRLPMAIRHSPPRPRIERVYPGSGHYDVHRAMRWRRRARLLLLVVVSAAMGAAIAIFATKGL